MVWDVDDVPDAMPDAMVMTNQPKTILGGD